MRKIFLATALLLFVGAGCITANTTIVPTPIPESIAPSPAPVVPNAELPSLPSGKVAARSSDNAVVLHINPECQLTFAITGPEPYTLDDKTTVVGQYYSVVYGKKDDLLMEAVMQTQAEYAASADSNIDSHFSPTFMTDAGSVVRVLSYPSPASMDCQAWLMGE